MAKGYIEYRSEGTTERFPITGASTVVGRDASCDVTINDRTLSRQHFRLFEKDDTIYVEDMGSHNGTFLEGILLEKPLPLSVGERITAGTAAFSYVPPEKETDPFLKGVVKGWYSSDSLIQERLPIVKASFGPTAKDDVEETQEIRRLSFLYGAAEMFVESEDVDALLQSVGERLFQETTADYIAVLLNDVRQGQIRCVGQWHRGVFKKDTRLLLSRNVMREAVKARAGVLSVAAQEDSRFADAQSIQEMHINSVVCAPILHGDHTWGVLYLDTRSVEATLGHEDLQLVTCLANLAAIFLEGLRLRDEVAETTHKRTMLERYFSKGLAEKLLQGGSDLDQGCKSVTGTLLCVDIRSFTTMAEHADPPEVVAMLNEFYGAATRAVFAHNGVVDKYIGDAVLAVFGSPIEDPNHARVAMNCGDAIIANMREVNRRREEEGMPAIQVGVGIATGQFVHGNVGDADKLEYTVIGHTVNVAFRLAGLAKAGQILISDATRQAAGEQSAISLGSTVLKGRHDATIIFSLPEDDD